MRFHQAMKLHNGDEVRIKAFDASGVPNVVTVQSTYVVAGLVPRKYILDGPAPVLWIVDTMGHHWMHTEVA